MTDMNVEWARELLREAVGIYLAHLMPDEDAEALACVKTGRNFIGVELDPGYFAIAERRIAEAQLQLPLLEVT